MKNNKVKTNYCNNYCGLACVNGTCPNALDDLDRRSDTDAYAMYHLDKKVKCNECYEYKGCDDCCFNGTNMCDKTELKVNAK